jgi:hypothetical protein
LEDVDGRIILKWIVKKEDEGMNRIRVAQDDTEDTDSSEHSGLLTQ